ncbi:MAG: sulfatase [Verrucomicrobiales bacterium]|nr:sulfatase [Verrucomicrobiales bacterium]MCP5527569.1 sulfatase [Verrucomicrobiales bacterium]
MNRRCCRFAGRGLLWLALVAAGAPRVAVAATPAASPNLVIVHTDEHSYRTLGCYRRLLPEDQACVWGPGVTVSTPNIDWLAAHGAIATRFFATSPVCTPSRASFVTGLYPQSTGAVRNDLPMRDEMVTFAEVLRRRGYATGYAGKWHLDGPARPGWAPRRDFGFSDHRYMFNRGHWKQLEDTDAGPRVKARNARGQPTYDLEGADETSFTTDFLTDRAIAFVREHRDRPFCYMLSLPDPHGPNTVRPPYDTMFAGLPFQQPVSAKQSGKELPGYAAVRSDRFNARQMALYFGMVKCIDDNVGRLLAALREADLLERTVVVFTSDHGDLCGEHGRHNKGVPLDTSAAIPFVLYAPGLVPAGTRVGTALGTVDFKPTILGLLGVPDAGRTEGRDASGLFRGRPAAAGWKDLAFVRIGDEGQGANRWIGAFTSRYKLVVSPTDAPGFFDLQEDPFELENRLGDPRYAATVRELKAELADYCRTFAEPLYAEAACRAALE